MPPTSLELEPAVAPVGAGPREGRAVTMSDIARSVGVTHITVHNALRGKGRVSPQMRDKIHRVARDMGYESNQLARSLATGRAHAIGVMAYRLQSPLAAQQLAGVEEEAVDRGYIVQVAAHLHDPERALGALRQMSARRLDGVISLSSIANLQEGVADGLSGLRLPYVFSFHEPSEGDGAAFTADSVSVDHAQGVALAVRHLLEQGRRRLVFLAGPPARTATRLRLEGFRRAHLEAGVATDERLIRFGEDFFPQDGCGLMADILSAPGPRPDGAVCASDGLAAGVMQACHAAGIAVPDEMAITGFDDSPLCAALGVPLSSVRMPVEEVGRQCVRRLLSRIEDPSQWEAQRLRLPCTLTVRASSGPRN